MSGIELSSAVLVKLIICWAKRCLPFFEAQPMLYHKLAMKTSFDILSFEPDVAAPEILFELHRDVFNVGKTWFNDQYSFMTMKKQLKIGW